MGERYSLYLKDEDDGLQEFIDDYSDVVGGESKLIKMGLQHLKAEKIEALESLKTSEGFDEIT